MFNNQFDLGINRFSALTQKEMNTYKCRSKGVARNHIPKFRQPLPANFVRKPVDALPTDVDWRTFPTNVVTPVKGDFTWKNPQLSNLLSSYTVDILYRSGTLRQLLGICFDSSDWVTCRVGFWFALRVIRSTYILQRHIPTHLCSPPPILLTQMAMCTPNPNACGGGHTLHLHFTDCKSLILATLYYRHWWLRRRHCQALPLPHPPSTYDYRSWILAVGVWVGVRVE